MGIILELYQKMINDELSEEQKKELHRIVISQHDKPDTPTKNDSHYYDMYNKL